MKYPVVCFCIRRRFFYLLLSSVFLTYLSEGCCAKANERYNAILIFLQTKKASTNRVSLSATPKIAYQLRKIIDPLSYALSVPVFCFAHSIQRILQPVKYNLSFCLCAFFRFLAAVMGTVKRLRPNASDGALTSPHSLLCIGMHHRGIFPEALADVLKIDITKAFATTSREPVRVDRRQKYSGASSCAQS